MDYLTQASRLAFLSSAALWPVFSIAQDDTLKLNGVEITAIVTPEQVGDLVQTARLESGQVHANVGSYLQVNSNLSLRSYGPGSSIGLSIRGSSAAQSQVSINGLIFENPGLAQADLSLLPVGLFGSFRLLRGSGGAYLGNAAIGGSLLLETASDINKIIEIDAGLGSFGEQNLALSARYHTGKVKHHTTIYRYAAENDFQRADPLNPSQTEAQPNAAFLSRGVAQSAEVQFDSNASLYFFGWYGAVDRQLPPNISKPASSESQEDRVARVQTGIKNRWKGWDWNTDMAFTSTELNYDNPELGPIDLSESQTFQAKIKASRKVNWGSYFALLQYQASRAETTYYSKAHERQSPSIVAGLKQDFWNSKLAYSFSLRQEWLNGAALPPIPHLGLEWQALERVSLRANLGRAYRLPGLNDLFWNPGGNPNLKPESGWFQELGLHLAEPRANPRYDISLSGFNRYIENWILWQPGASYWSPVNLRAVHTSGAELLANWRCDRKRFRLSQSLEATYTKARNLNQAGEQEATDAQLIYTPFLSVFYRQEWAFWKERLIPEFKIRFQSERFTTADNSRSLEPFTLLDLAIATKLSICNQPLSVRFAVLNATDNEYQLQASHPMPGRQYQVSLNFQISKPKK